jgi:hypothetical protein
LVDNNAHAALTNPGAPRSAYFIEVI